MILTGVARAEAALAVASGTGNYNAELTPDTRRPRDVLRDTMLFYDTQAKDIIADIILRLKEEQMRGTASELALMYKKFSECTQIAIDCASKLAPYEHPKLESIEVRKELTHRFVIRAPTVMPDEKEWLAKAQVEQRILASKPGHDLIVEPKPAQLTVQQAYKNAIADIEVIASVGDDPFDPDAPDSDDDDYDDGFDHDEDI